VPPAASRRPRSFRNQALLSIGTILAKKARARGYRFDMEGHIRLMVMNRLSDPCSKLGLRERIQGVYLPGVDVGQVEYHHLLRAMEADPAEGGHREGNRRPAVRAVRHGSASGLLRRDLELLRKGPLDHGRGDPPARVQPGQPAGPEADHHRAVDDPGGDPAGVPRVRREPAGQEDGGGGGAGLEGAVRDPAGGVPWPTGGR